MQTKTIAPVLALTATAPSLTYLEPAELLGDFPRFYASAAGESPLILSYTATQADLDRGPGWRWLSGHRP